MPICNVFADLPQIISETPVGILQGAPVYTLVHLFLLLPSSLPRSMMAEAGMGSNPGGMDVSKENEQPTRVAYRTNLVECHFSRSLFS